MIILLPPFRDNADIHDYLEIDELPNNLWDGKIAFLDRDGVINVGSENYINSPDEVKLLPNADSLSENYVDMDIGYVL